MILMLHETCVFTMNAGNISFKNFVETTEASVINYGDCKARLTRHSVGAVLGDQQVHISYFYILHILYFNAYFTYSGV